MEAVTVASGSVYQLPACEYSMPGTEFAGWQTGEETKQPGESVTVTADTVVTAAWLDPPYVVTLSPGEAVGEDVIITSAYPENWTEELYEAGGMFIAGEDKFCLPENPFTVPEGKLFTGWKLDGDNTIYDPGYYLDIGNYTLTAQFGSAHTVTLADMPSFASWIGDGAEQTFGTGARVTVTVELNGTDYGAGTRLSALRVTGEGIDPITVTEDFLGTPLLSSTYSVTSDATLYEVRFTMPDADVTVTAVWQYPAFGIPDFDIPTGTTRIEASAFEGIAATVVAIPENCESVGDYAFRDCADLTMIRIPAECALGTDVFDGCTKVYVYGAAGSPAEAYCQSHGNCVFVAEGQN